MGAEVYTEEGIETGSQDHGGEARVAWLSERVSELNMKLEAVLSRVAQLEQELAELRERAAAPAAVPAGPARPLASNEFFGSDANQALSPGIQEVLRSVYSGDIESAQKLLLALSREEMSRNTSVVALVAGTLCIQRGDMAGGLTALQRARQFTDDPRLLKVIEKLEAQINRA